MNKLNTRGVLYISNNCNIRCKFCVFRHQLNKSPNPTLSNVKECLLSLKNKYKLTHIDLAGQEPTMNKDLKEILEFCNSIGLKPTIVTNGQLTSVIENVLPDLDDLVLSVYNIGKDYEETAQVKGSWKRLQNTLKLLKRNDFKFRINCHVYLLNLKRLKEIVDIAATADAILDFLGFCGDEFSNETVATYTQSAKVIKEAIDYSKKYPNLIINVRWIPLCMMRGYEKYVLNWHQWIYDPYSWNESAGNGLNLITKEDYENWIKMKMGVNYKQDKCLNCANRNICDGINLQYIKRFGTKEFKPMNAELIMDHMFYRKELNKEISQ